MNSSFIQQNIDEVVTNLSTKGIGRAATLQLLAKKNLDDYHTQAFYNEIKEFTEILHQSDDIEIGDICWNWKMKMLNHGLVDNHHLEQLQQEFNICSLDIYYPSFLEIIKIIKMKQSVGWSVLHLFKIIMELLTTNCDNMKQLQAFCCDVDFIIQDEMGYRLRGILLFCNYVLDLQKFGFSECQIYFLICSSNIKEYDSYKIWKLYLQQYQNDYSKDLGFFLFTKYATDFQSTTFIFLCKQHNFTNNWEQFQIRLKIKKCWLLLQLCCLANIIITLTTQTFLIFKNMNILLDIHTIIKWINNINWKEAVWENNETSCKTLLQLITSPQHILFSHYQYEIYLSQNIEEIRNITLKNIKFKSNLIFSYAILLAQQKSCNDPKAIIYSNNEICLEINEIILPNISIIEYDNILNIARKCYKDNKNNKIQEIKKIAEIKKIEEINERQKILYQKQQEKMIEDKKKEQRKELKKKKKQRKLIEQQNQKKMQEQCLLQWNYVIKYQKEQRNFAQKIVLSIHQWKTRSSNIVYTGKILSLNRFLILYCYRILSFIFEYLECRFKQVPFDVFNYLSEAEFVATPNESKLLLESDCGKLINNNNILKIIQSYGFSIFQQEKVLTYNSDSLKESLLKSCNKLLDKQIIKKIQDVISIKTFYKYKSMKFLITLLIENIKLFETFLNIYPNYFDKMKSLIYVDELNCSLTHINDLEQKFKIFNLKYAMVQKVDNKSFLSWLNNPNNDLKNVLGIGIKIDFK